MLRPVNPSAEGSRVETGDPRVLAQTLGQAHPRRGLRGGPPMLTAARRAYLGAEWTGAHDRRLRPGAVTTVAV